MNKLKLIKKELEECAEYNFDNWNKCDLQMFEEIVIATEKVVKKLTISAVVKSLPEHLIYQKAHELDEKEFEQWMYDNQ